MINLYDSASELQPLVGCFNALCHPPGIHVWNIKVDHGGRDSTQEQQLDNMSRVFVDE